MKKFKYFGKEYIVEDKYNYIAIDEDGIVYVYIDKPSRDEEEWYSCGYKEVGWIGPESLIDWEESLSNINSWLDWVRKERKDEEIQILWYGI